MDFNVEDKVYVSTKNWKTDRPSKKLSEQIVGPYPIVEKKGYSFKVGLLALIKIYPVFPVDILRRAAENPFLG